MMRKTMSWQARLLGVALLLSAAVACAQQAVADFKGGPPSGAYSFTSSTPRTLPELLRGQGEPTAIIGHLFLPPGDGPVPAIVFMHGSGGIFDAMLGYWPRHFNAQGWAMLALDTFGPRGVKSTAEDQSQVPFAADVADVYAALRLMASHPRIDARRVALMGTSRGGTATWRAALQRIIDAQPPGARYAAFIPMYSGGCVGGVSVRVRPGVFGKAPMLWLHGDADDYAAMAPCKDYAERIAAAGTPSTFEVLPGAGHKFDQDSPRRVHVRGAQITRASCPLELDMQTLVYHDRSTGQKLTPDEVKEMLRSQCSAVGASVEGNHAARERAAATIDAFLQRHVGP